MKTIIFDLPSETLKLLDDAGDVIKQYDIEEATLSDYPLVEIARAINLYEALWQYPREEKMVKIVLPDEFPV